MVDSLWWLMMIDNIDIILHRIFTLWLEMEGDHGRIESSLYRQYEGYCCKYYRYYTISLNNFCSTLTSRIYALKFETIRSQVTTNGGFNMLYLSTPDENMSILGSKLITYWNLCVNHDILWDISKHTLGFSVIL